MQPVASAGGRVAAASRPEGERRVRRFGRHRDVRIAHSGEVDACAGRPYPERLPQTRRGEARRRRVLVPEFVRSSTEPATGTCSCSSWPSGSRARRPWMCRRLCARHNLRPWRRSQCRRNPSGDEPTWLSGRTTARLRPVVRSAQGRASPARPQWSRQSQSMSWRQRLALPVQRLNGSRWCGGCFALRRNRIVWDQPLRRRSDSGTRLASPRAIRAATVESAPVAAMLEIGEMPGHGTLQAGHLF